MYVEAFLSILHIYSLSPFPSLNPSAAFWEVFFNTLHFFSVVLSLLISPRSDSFYFDDITFYILPNSLSCFMDANLAFVFTFLKLIFIKDIL